MEAASGAEGVLQAAVERAPQAMWCVDVTGRLVWANAAARCMLQIDVVEGQLLREVVATAAVSDRLEALRTGERGEDTMAWSDGQRFRVTAYAVGDDEEQVHHVYAAVEAAVEEVTDSEGYEVPEQLRALIERPPAGICIIQDGRFVYANEVIEEITGYEASELTAPSREVADLVVEEDRELVRDHLQQPASSEATRGRYTVRLQQEAGGVVEVEIRAVPTQYRGRPAYVAVVLDFTDDQLATSNLKAILDNSTEGFILLDRDQRVMAYNRSAQQMVQQLQQLELQRGEPAAKFVRPEHRAAFRQYAMRALIGETMRSEQRVEMEDGTGHWVELIYAPVIRRGYTMGVCVSMQRVTTRKQTELELQSRERQLRLQNEVMLELTHQHAMQQVDVDGMIRAITEKVAETLDVAACAVWCFEDEQARCADFYDREAAAHEERPTVPLADLTAYFEALSRHRAVAFSDLDQDERFEQLHAYIRQRGLRAVLHAPVRLDHEVVGVLALEHLETPRSWRAEERQFLSSAADFIALALEAQHRRHMQEALREAYQRLELHIQNSPLAFIDVDSEFRVRRWSQRAEELFGYTAEEVAGQMLLDGINLVHPDDVERVLDEVGEWLGGDEETTVIRNRNITRSGCVLECEWYNSVIRNDQGDVVAIVSLVQDVTAQVEYEQELVAAKEEAEEMNRLKTAFLANMSHEVRTPLTAIIGFADVLAEEVEEPHRELVGFIRRGGTRLMETLDSVLNLAQLEGRSFELQPHWFDLVAFAEDRLTLFNLQAQQRGLDLHLEAPETPLRVRLDAAALGRILSNLVSNALKFTSEGSVIVRLSERGEWVEMQVEDTGVGIAAEFLPFAFDEFRQESSGVTRRYEGSGLGLAITRRLVELMGGTIAVESTQNVGTTFTVQLPSAMPEHDAGSGGAS